MSLTDLWQNMRDKLAKEKSSPASELLPRMRGSAPPPTQPKAKHGSASLADATPFANEILAPPPSPSIAPPPWADVYPGHHRALVADLAKRGESMANWEIQDGRDLGVSETGHTVAFTLHKTGTSATIQVELTLCKGQLSKVRVR